MSSTSMEILDDTLVVTASKDLREFDSANFDVEGDTIVQKLDDPRVRNVVMDLSGTDYYGSTAINMFLRIDRKARANKGRLVFVGLSPHEAEVLHITKLDSIWMVCKTRDEALESLRQNKPAPG